MRALVVLLGLLVASPAFAHGGGLNRCGCHVNHKTGECHCHHDYGCGCSCQPAHCGLSKSSSLPWEPAVCTDTGAPEFMLVRGGGHGGYKGSSHSSSRSGGSSTAVRGYTKKNGTYVQPHRRSAPDGSKTNNWSTKGNVNPYTGKQGTQNL
jgi:hypothetical protein